MFHKISEQIIAYAIRNNALDENMAEEYIYGLEISISVLASYVSVLIIGLLMGMLWQSAVFLALYVSVRRFAGGFHFKSQIVCYISMCVMSPIVLLIIKYTENNTVLYSVIMAISALVLLILSPVPAIEKPLDTKEKTVYGIAARAIIFIIAFIYAALCFFDRMYAAKIMAVTLSAAAIFAILGKIKYKLYERTGAVSI